MNNLKIIRDVKTKCLLIIWLVFSESLYAQFQPDIKPWSVLTEARNNEETDYVKMIKRCRDSAVEIKQYDSLKRLLFWYRQSEPGRSPELRITCYFYNSEGRLKKQYFIKEDHHKVWEYHYDTAGRKTEVYECKITWNGINPELSGIRNDFFFYLYSGKGDQLKKAVYMLNRFDSLKYKNDSIKSYKLLEVSYDSLNKEYQKVMLNAKGDTLFLTRTFYNSNGRIMSIKYKGSRNTFVTNKFMYLPDSSHSAGKLERIDLWHLENGDENRPLSFGSNYYIYDSGKIIRTYLVFSGFLVADEQFTYEKNGKPIRAEYYFYQNDKLKQTYYRYFYNQEGRLIKCVIKEKGRRKTIYRYHYLQ